MFWESAVGLHVEDLCVFMSRAIAGHTMTFAPRTGTAMGLFLYLKTGTAVLYTDGIPLLTIPAQYTLYVPYQPEYCLTFSEESTYLLLSFQLFRFEDPLLPPRELLLTIPLGQEFAKMQEAALQAGTLGDLARKSAFFLLLARTAPAFLEAFSPGLARIARGVAALEMHFLENTPVAEYAALCGLRENRFRSLFSEHFGMSPLEYRNTLRMRYAQQLLQQFHCSVAEAAQAAGFTSTSYFCRMHRKLFGTSPAGQEVKHGKMDEMA